MPSVSRPDTKPDRPLLALKLVDELMLAIYVTSFYEG